MENLLEIAYWKYSMDSFSYFIWDPLNFFTGSEIKKSENKKYRTFSEYAPKFSSYLYSSEDIFRKFSKFASKIHPKTSIRIPLHIFAWISENWFMNSVWNFFWDYFCKSCTVAFKHYSRHTLIKCMVTLKILGNIFLQDYFKFRYPQGRSFGNASSGFLKFYQWLLQDLTYLSQHELLVKQIIFILK